MSFVTTTPATMTCAATDLAAIGSRIDTANAAAAAVTTRLAAPAADEISTAIVALFNEHARSFQTLTARATALLDEFAVALQAGARSYAWVEAGIGSSMQELLGVAHASTQALGPSVIGSGITVGSAAGSAVSSIPKAMAAALAPATAMVMGGTGTPIPGQSYIDNVLEAFIKPNTAWAVPQGLATPEELYPYTGVLDLRFDISVSRGLDSPAQRDQRAPCRRKPCHRLRLLAKRHDLVVGDEVFGRSGFECAKPRPAVLCAGG